MKIMLVSIIVLLLSTATWAQCELSVDLADVSCTHVDDPCHGDYTTHGCQSITFEAPCTQGYYLQALMSCVSGGDCKQCLSEAWITDEWGKVLPNACVHNSCGSNSNCDPWHITVDLDQGQTYILHVCKLDCADDGTDCTDCSATCSAKATVTEDEP